MYRKFLPKHLHYLFEKEDTGEVNQPRKFDFNKQIAHTIQSKEQKERERQNRHYVKRWEKLSSREQEIVALVCMGQKNHQIADILGLAHGTVKKHLDNIFGKLGLHDRHDIRLALKDWDFRTWWEDRHLLPTRLPDIHM